MGDGLSFADIWSTVYILLKGIELKMDDFLFSVELFHEFLRKQACSRSNSTRIGKYFVNFVAAGFSLLRKN